MDKVLQGCDHCSVAYLDDVVIYSNSWHEHIQHLSLVLGKIQRAGLTLNPEKCVWAQKETRYFCYQLGRGEIRLQVDKVAATRDCPRPRTKKEVVVPGTHQLVQMVCPGPGPGEEHPVVFLCRKLQPRETRYSTVEKEGLAIKWALESLHYYLLGREFNFEREHRALTWIHTMKDHNSRLTWWDLTLQPFNFNIQHCSGKTNVVVDYLSRLPHIVNLQEEGDDVMTVILIVLAHMLFCCILVAASY